MAIRQQERGGIHGLKGKENKTENGQGKNGSRKQN